MFNVILQKPNTKAEIIAEGVGEEEIIDVAKAAPDEERLFYCIDSMGRSERMDEFLRRNRLKIKYELPENPKGEE